MRIVGMLSGTWGLAVCAALYAVLPSALPAAERTYTLQDAFRASLDTYETVRISEEGLVQAESRVDQAWTYVYPRLVARAAYTRYNDTLPETGPFFQPLNEVTAGAVLSQPLYTGGRTLAAYRYAKDLRDASRNEFSATKRDTLLNAGAAYYEVLKAQRLVVVSKDSLERMERHQKVTEREAVTRRTKMNVSASLRANTLVSQARIALIAAEDRLRVARRKLATLTGFPAEAVLVEPSPIESPSADMEALRQTAYVNREEFAAAKSNEAAAAENIALVRGGHLPQAYAEGGVQYKSSSPDTLMDATVLYGGIRLAVPLFEGGLMKAEAAEARSKLRQAELSGALLKKTIGDEVYESRVYLDTVTAVLDAAKSQYDDATKNFSTVESLFGEGLTTSLNLIDAQQALFIAEREYVNSLYERQVAILRLQRSIGVLGKEAL